MIQQRFEIRKSPEISALVAKYNDYAENYVVGEEEAQMLTVLPSLSEWERVVLFALSEHKTVRKFAKFFDISEWTARHTITDIKDKVKDLYKKKSK